MSEISMREMLEAGVHFGHQTRYWNPRMAAYLFGHRNKIHIIDLEKTKILFQEALNFASKLSANKGTILFVGTKRAAQQIIKEEAQRCAMPYINLRWLGGLLTNYQTVKQSINRLRDLEEMKTDGSMERMSKKEILHFERELEKLERNLSGIKDMNGWPDALFVIDVGYEDIAVSEAVKLKIPVIGIVDSNNSPVGVDYVIPGNDDAIRSIRLYTKAVADAIITGKDSVAHLGERGDKDEFVELDAEGAPIVEARPEKVQVKKKVAKKRAKKVGEAKADSTKEQKSAAQVEEQAVEAAAELNKEDAEAAEKEDAGTAEPVEKEAGTAEKEDAGTAEPVEKEAGTAEKEDVSNPEMQPEEAAASDEDQARKAATHRLVEIASQREQLITYKDLSDWIKTETGILIPYSGSQMYVMLDDISKAENQAGRGLLSALVVRGREKTPGRGFYNLAKGLGKDIGTTDEEKEEFWKKELDTVYDSHTGATPAQAGVQ